MLEPDVSPGSLRRAHLAAARERASVVLRKPIKGAFELLLAQDVAWLVHEVARLDELLISTGYQPEHGQP